MPGTGSPSPEQKAEPDLASVGNELQRIRAYSRDAHVIECIDIAYRFVGKAADAAIKAHFSGAEKPVPKDS